MKKMPHVIWVCPTSKAFYRAKGEVRCRPGSVIPKLVEAGVKINVLIPFDATLLPKTKLSSNRTTTHTVKLSQSYLVDIIKLTRGANNPGIYMAKTPFLEPALSHSVFTKAAIKLAQQMRKPVDVFHLFDWQTSLLPLFLELETTQHQIFKNTKSLLISQSFHEMGYYSPAMMDHLGLPKGLFHPDGIEFYGRLSFLKAGFLFSDAVGLVESTSPRTRISRNGNQMDGFLESVAFKLRRWASDRSIKAHLDAYKDLMAEPKSSKLLPRLLRQADHFKDEVERVNETWGPPPPDRYDVNTMAFLLQAPCKTYAYWEWSGHAVHEFGIILENGRSGSRKLLSRGLGPLGEYWIDVQPDSEYIAELVSVSPSGKTKTLLRSKPLMVPRMSPSPNTTAQFVDVRSNQRFTMASDGLWESVRSKLAPGGTSAWEWEHGVLSSSSSSSSFQTAMEHKWPDPVTLKDK